MMKALARTTLVVLLVFTVIYSVDYAICEAEVIETVVPYNFPSGLVNIIQHSENPDTPFWHWVEDKYPLVKLNYTVQYDGWLQIFTYAYNGTRPEMLLNGVEIFRSKNPFYSEQVYSGDFMELVLYPPERLDSTFTVDVDHRSQTIYEVYNWDDLIGDLVFTESPREAIDVEILWSPEELVDGCSMVFGFEGVGEGCTWVWTLIGDGLFVESSDSHFITEPLSSGDYMVKLFVEDLFGYNETVAAPFIVKPDSMSLLLDPSLTSIDVVDLICPSSVLGDEIVDASVAVNFSAPVSRDIRVLIKDLGSGEVLSSVEDQLTGDVSKVYDFSFISSLTDMLVEASVEFLHEDEWVADGETLAVTIQVVSPVQNSSIPGFSGLEITLSLVIYGLKRKYW